MQTILIATSIVLGLPCKTPLHPNAITFSPVFVLHIPLLARRSKKMQRSLELYLVVCRTT